MIVIVDCDRDRDRNGGDDGHGDGRGHGDGDGDGDGGGDGDGDGDGDVAMAMAMAMGVQPCESGVVIEQIPLNLSDLINENKNIHLMLDHLLQCLKLRESLESIRFNGGNLVIVQFSEGRHMRGWR